MLTINCALSYRFLISGGKDRSLYLYQANPSFDHADVSSAVPPYLPCAYVGKAHKRIIWDIAWVTVDDDMGVFASVSRDGSVKIWSILSDRKGENNLSKLVCLTSLSPFGVKAVTAVDVTAQVLSLSSGDQQDAGWLLAFGAESGCMQLWFLSETLLKVADVSSDIDMCSLVHTVAPEYCHGAAVRRLRWCAEESEDVGLRWKLASCGDDHCVRVFNVTP
jgi:elongator complex protein 2